MSREQQAAGSTLLVRLRSRSKVIESPDLRCYSRSHHRFGQPTLRPSYKASLVRIVRISVCAQRGTQSPIKKGRRHRQAADTLSGDLQCLRRQIRALWQSYLRWLRLGDCWNAEFLGSQVVVALWMLDSQLHSFIERLLLHYPCLHPFCLATFAPYKQLSLLILKWRQTQLHCLRRER